MSLTDRETLELNELCDAVVERSITPQQEARLEGWLAASEDARRYYVTAMDLSASLGRYASEMQMGPADSPGGWTPRIAGHSNRSVAIWGPLALAASLLIAVVAWMFSRPTPIPIANEIVARPAHTEPAEYVARITAAKQSVWGEASESLKTGAFLRRGQQLELADGFAEVTFDCGAVVLLQGPATLDVNSAWDSTLRRGALTANVPPQAIGFRVSNPAVEVVDLGTEFSMVADGQGAGVFVLEGEVEAMPRGADADTVLLRTNESRRFVRSNEESPNRSNDADDSAQMFERFKTPVPLDRPGNAFNYVRWSFDKSRGRMLLAEVAGFDFPADDAGLKLLANSPRIRDRALVEGFHKRALQFDGDLIAKAKFPGLSGSSPRTIAFWVKTPENSQLSSAYSMVAWRADSEKLGSRPVHIGWNRNPAEGPLGAIRTDFSGGHAMGMTPLRDGRWHHVSVIFLPGEDADAPVQVKQYVDGRLESNTVTPGERRSIGANVKVDANPGSADWLWVGCRLGANGPKKERFRGDIDELVIADRSLEPGEVVQLMDGVMAAAAN